MNSFSDITSSSLSFHTVPLLEADISPWNIDFFYQRMVAPHKIQTQGITKALLICDPKKERPF